MARRTKGFGVPARSHAARPQGVGDGPLLCVGEGKSASLPGPVEDPAEQPAGAKKTGVLPRSLVLLPLCGRKIAGNVPILRRVRKCGRSPTRRRTPRTGRRGNDARPRRSRKSMQGKGLGTITFAAAVAPRTARGVSGLRKITEKTTHNRGRVFPQVNPLGGGAAGTEP